MSDGPCTRKHTLEAPTVKNATKSVSQKKDLPKKDLPKKDLPKKDPPKKDPHKKTTQSVLTEHSEQSTQPAQKTANIPIKTCTNFA
jgi:hypothetical protein